MVVVCCLLIIVCCLDARYLCVARCLFVLSCVVSCCVFDCWLVFLLLVVGYCWRSALVVDCCLTCVVCWLVFA